MVLFWFFNFTYNYNKIIVGGIYEEDNIVVNVISINNRM